MALIDVRCFACGAVAEVNRPASDWPQTPVCPACGGSTEQVHLPPREVTYAPAVVVYKAPDGTFRFPGETDGSATVKYDRLGYERIEARGWADVRRLEKSVNTQQASEIRRRVERQRQAYEASVKDRRSDLYNAINNGFLMPVMQPNAKGELVKVGERFVKLSARGRDLAMAAVARNNGKPGPQFRESGGYIEAYSMDRSNREESRRSDGKRGRD